MKLLLKKIILITIFIYSAFLLNSVFATSEQPELSIEVSKNKIKPGEEFIATIKFNNNGSTECYGFDFNLEYDASTLELIETKKVISDGTGILNDKREDSIKFILASMSAIERQEDLFETTFKVKQDANKGKTTLNISTTNNRTPIENGNGEVKTTIVPASITIDAEIKEEKNNENKININKETNENTYTAEEQNKTVIRLDEEEQTSEDTTTDANEKNAKSQNNTQSGLPTAVVVTLIIISIIGISAIVMMLKKKKK